MPSKKSIQGKKNVLKKKRLRLLRAMKRGVTGPDKGLTKKLGENFTEKAIAEASEKNISGKGEGLKGIIEDADRLRNNIKIRAGELSNRAATKYALDAIGVLNSKKRKKVHEIMKDFGESRFRPSQEKLITERYELAKIKELKEILGVEKAAVFELKWISAFRKLSKETKKHTG